MVYGLDTRRHNFIAFMIRLDNYTNFYIKFSLKLSLASFRFYFVPDKSVSVRFYR